MGTSLSGLTPATTFDGLLKVGDNDPLTADLKAISTGDGADTMLELSTSALQIGGATGMYWDNTNKRLGIGTDSPSTPLQVNGAIRSSGTGTQSFEFSAASLAQFRAIFGSVGFRVGSGMFIGGTDGGPAASTRLHVKGSGATSATTSLLVQNSAGTNIFKVVDDNTMFYHTHKFRSAGGYLYIEVEGNADRSLKMGPTFTATSYNGHIFKTFDGVSGYPEVMRITGNGDQFVGIGETAPTARLHVKGSGATSATTSLLVQNSAGADVLETLDNGSVGVGCPVNSSYRVTMTSGVLRLKDLLFGQAGSAAINNTSLLTMKWNGSTGIGISGGGAIDATARLHIKGSGNDNTTTSLLVQNSDGDDMVKVSDDGGTTIKSFGASNTLVVDSSLGTSSLEMQAQGQQRFRIQASGSTTRFSPNNTGGITFIGNGIFTGGAFDIPAARLQVKGSGNDATTTALLVQNSDGDDILKVLDSKEIQLNTGITGSITTIDATTTNLKQGDLYFRASTGGYLGRFNPTGFQIGNGSTNPTARLQVKGSGATSATTALLVENSAGDLNLKVNDDGSVFSHGGGARISSNTGFGEGVLASVTTANNTSAFGVGALQAVTTGVSNTGIGWRAGYATTGSNNSFVGLMAGYTNSSGANNTGIGTRVLYNNGTASDNTAVGYLADSAGFSGNVILGRGATATAGNQFVVGSSTTNAGAVDVVGDPTPTHTWEVVINGVKYRILLQEVV